MAKSQLDYRLSSLSPRLSDWTGVGTTPTQKPATVSFGAGTHTIDHQITLPDGGILRGAGKDATILKFTKSLYALFGKGPWKAGPADTPGWSSGGGLIQAENRTGVWVEDCTLEFPSHPQKAHHYEVGYNATHFGGCRDGGIRNVRIVNSDSGILQYHNRNLLLDNVELAWPGVTKNSAGHVAHYGVMFGRDTTACLLQRLDCQGLARHDTDVANGAHHNVVRASKFKNYVSSHHGGNPHHNLFTDIDVGIGNRVFSDSGGSLDAMPHNGSGEVFWNLHKADGSPISQLPPFSGSRYWQKSLSLAGHTLNRLNNDLSKEWVEGITSVDPADVWLAQRGVGSQPPPPPPTGQFPVGTQIKALATLKIRTAPKMAATQIGTQPMGATGVVVEAEVHDPVSGYDYAKINFGGGVDGYCGINLLAKT